MAGWPVEQKPGSLHAVGGAVPIGAQPRQILSPEVAAAMDHMLAVVPDARGKTGTTNNGVDVVFVRNFPALNLLTAIWMGNDDHFPASVASGALVAELWRRYMQAVAGRG